MLQQMTELILRPQKVFKFVETLKHY